MKLGRNPIELIDLEPLEGVTEPNLDQTKSKHKITKTKIRAVEPSENKG